ncbi:putative oxidoreductase [Pseudocercospora fuligena]|uniref:Putative oxidoreductase n=1 Tax=Pseudocercospora fuligena TaxID=685502 RepID=A0A8H6RCP9_9PEZI|nr:putative oxidoreductase [Pseudocercospora fuligena]
MSPETLSLAGKTALVTGSGRETGIGAAIARALARNGASVAIHYVSESSKSRAERVAASIEKDFGTKTTVVHGSVDNYDTAKKIVEDILKAFNVDHTDILALTSRVNNGATASNTSLMDVTPEQLEQDFAVNVFGTIYMTQAAVGVGRMPPGGRIINIGSIISKVLRPPMAPPVYGVTKAATDALTTLWAGELGKSHGITVNTLAPGPVPTDIAREFLENDDGSPTDAARSMYEQTRAADRVGTAQDLADATLLLVSEKSRWITAQYISVSGGITGTM